jgi:hypothetical protein
VKCLALASYKPGPLFQISFFLLIFIKPLPFQSLLDSCVILTNSFSFQSNNFNYQLQLIKSPKALCANLPHCLHGAISQCVTPVFPAPWMNQLNCQITGHTMMPSSPRLHRFCFGFVHFWKEVFTFFWVTFFRGLKKSNFCSLEIV